MCGCALSSESLPRPAVPLWYPLRRPFRPDRLRRGTTGTRGTLRDASTPIAPRLGAERSLVQIQSPRLSEDCSVSPRHVGAGYDGDVRGLSRGLGAIVFVGCMAGLALPSTVGMGAARDDQTRRGPPRGLIARWTGPNAELRKTVPIARRPGRRARAALTLPLPMVKRGDRIKFNGEVTLTTTCVPLKRRCIGRRYSFDPHLRARIVIANRARAAGRRTLPVTRTVKLTCGQNPPDRNHHCPLVISSGSLVVDHPRRLPCRPRRCRLNMVVSAYNRRARGGEVVVVGADRPDGSVDQGKARLNAAILRDGADIAMRSRGTRDRLVRSLPASFDGGQHVVYSRRLEGLRRGDVLLIRAEQRTRIKRHTYFIGSKVVVGTRARAIHGNRFARRIVPRGATATDTNGFNCTLGPSAFRSPCLTKKAGLALIKRTPRRPGGGSRPLFVNLVSRGFPKVHRTSASYPRLRVIRGGGLTVTRLRPQAPASPRPAAD